MLARISTAALLATIMAVGVQAQTPSPSATESGTATGGPAMPSPAPTVQLNFYTPGQADMLISSLPGTRVYNLQNEEIGLIEDMLIDEGRTVKAFVIRTLARPTAQTAAAPMPAGSGQARAGENNGANPKSTGTTTSGPSTGEERLVAMAADSVIFARQPDGQMRPVINTTAAGLRNAPEFKFEGRFARKR